MRVFRHLRPVVVAVAGILALSVTACEPIEDRAATALAPAAMPSQEQGGQELFGHFEPVEDWPQWFDDADHAEWTWGSAGGVFAETPDRIWIAQRGELPLPEGATPGTPYGATNRGNSTGNSDGFNARCGETRTRGWERRWHHSIFVVDRNGREVDHWPQTEALFSALVDGRPCGRGPHKIEISPYDPDKARLDRRRPATSDPQVHV